MAAAWFDTRADGDVYYAADHNSMVSALVSGNADDAIITADGTDGHKIQGSGKTIVTTVGADDTTVPTSAAVKALKIDDFAVPGISDTTKDSNTTNHGLLLKAVAPVTGFMRFIGIAYGETIYALKELFAATTPSMDGAASAGTALTAARIDHIHPVDTSRAPLVNPTFTGVPAAPTPAPGTNTTQIATTEFVFANAPSIPSIPIGVEWTTNASSPTLVQVDQYGAATTLSAYDWLSHPIFSKIRRCTLNDAGVIQHYYGDTAVTIAHFYDGTDGQVMVEIPKFWYRTVALANKYRYLISPVALTGFKVHPAFVVNTVEKNFIYVSAFEGYQTGGKLCSLAGQAPAASTDLPTFRGYAQARGAGWELLDYNTVTAIELLFIIRNATLNSQSLYQGITDAGNTAAVNTGFTALVGTGSIDLGNASGEATDQGTAAKRSFSIFGIENFYGNVWKWVDGIKFLNREMWIADHGFDDTDPSSTPGTYVDTGLALPTAANEDITAVLYSSTYDYLFAPKTVSGTDYSLYLCDGAYSATGLRALLFGGYWHDAGIAGAFDFYASLAASGSTTSVGGRLVYK